jgi:hypothetical protein
MTIDHDLPKFLIRLVFAITFVVLISVIVWVYLKKTLPNKFIKKAMIELLLALVLTEINCILLLITDFGMLQDIEKYAGL